MLDWLRRYVIRRVFPDIQLWDGSYAYTWEADRRTLPISLGRGPALLVYDLGLERYVRREAVILANGSLGRVCLDCGFQNE